MSTIFDFLRAVEQRPSMYVGFDDRSRGDQMRNLQMVIHGYAAAVTRHEVPDPGKSFSSDFAAYLRKRFGWSVALGPIAAIRSASESDDAAWLLFWKLVWEFEANRSEPAAQ